MFFIFSKVLAFLAQPLAITVLLVIISWFIRSQRWKKILRITSISLLLLTSNYFIANDLMRTWEVPITPYSAIDKTYDYGVMLTGVTKTSMEPRDRTYFGRGADRATHTLQLYKLGIIKKVIVSGGSGRLDGGGVREADDLADFLKMAGIPDSAIIIENESKNTHESAMRVSEILSRFEGSKEVLLVTSGYHIRRSLACFKKAGVHVVGFAVDPLSEPRHFTPENLLVPKPEAMVVWQIMIKEWVGFVAYWFAGYI
jgi:uncharacterized SAM-binding protein YcdF (DUF218 family)